MWNYYFKIHRRGREKTIIHGRLLLNRRDTKMYKKLVILFLIGTLLTGCSKTANAVESTIEEVVSEEVTESIDAETIVEEEETSENIVVEESTIETEEEKEVLPIITEYNENAVDITDADLSIEYNGFMLTPYTTVLEVVKGLGYPDGYEANNDGFIAYTDDYRWNLIYPYFDKGQYCN